MKPGRRRLSVAGLDERSGGGHQRASSRSCPHRRSRSDRMSRRGRRGVPRDPRSYVGRECARQAGRAIRSRCFRRARPPRWRRQDRSRLHFLAASRSQGRCRSCRPARTRVRCRRCTEYRRTGTGSRPVHPATRASLAPHRRRRRARWPGPKCCRREAGQSDARPVPGMAPPVPSAGRAIHRRSHRRRGVARSCPWHWCRRPTRRARRPAGMRRLSNRAASLDVPDRRAEDNELGACGNEFDLRLDALVPPGDDVAGPGDREPATAIAAPAVFVRQQSAPAVVQQVGNHNAGGLAGSCGSEGHGMRLALIANRLRTRGDLLVVARLWLAKPNV